ncbi:mucoidy inhibitor MuiA family protein [Marixanthomonas sp. SCSIO 43207]|uniref:mucoidy inhibitor MuiA family protein n=1 Tax=Marixanthomonas sp. SCSIO 43207 TaxID=2779360 RepID=UPI001CA8830C|nr:mucoidy inhibitor MuiA family protein [Marixanthomonas sp. SCSIO 43207]UAB80559.1 mucoidy inhibitor MuiA family protein [Marixanthomonas sp. SCSIO 43207]
MKNFTLLFFLIPFLAFSNFEKKHTSNIKSVTVYLNGATIERHSNVILTKGENTLIFNDLSAAINENSIQISGIKNASISSLNYTIDYLEKGTVSEEYTILNTKIDGLKLKKNEIKNIIDGYEKELSILEENKKINSEATDLSLQKVKELSTYYRQRVTEINNIIYKEKKQLKELNKTINKYTSELYKIEDNRKEERGKITVKLTSETASNLSLVIKYNLENAGWFPVYDIKAENTSAPIKISYKANVYQQTGTDWENVNITLSTGDPNTNNLKPELSTKYLNFVSRNYRASTPIQRSNYKYNPTVNNVTGTVIDDTGLPLPGVNVVIKGTSTGTQTDFDGNYSLKVNNGEELVFSYVGFDTKSIPIHSTVMNVNLNASSEQLEEVVITGYGANSDISKALQGKVAGLAIKEPETLSNGTIKEVGITNTQFEISKPHTIKSSNEVTIIEVENIDMPALYQHYAAPELNENTFITATLKNWEQYDLLPGEANIYFEGNYSGKFMLNPQIASDSLNISLGIDPNVIVTREKLKNFKSSSFLGNNRIVNKGYKIEIKNNKKTPIKLLLEDRIPISQNEKIKLSDIETNDANFTKDTGILKWTIELKANQKSEKEFSYTVKYPKDKRINLN